MKNKIKKSQEKMDRKQALRKIGNFSKYTALTALGTYMILNPQQAQASSPNPEAPGTSF